MDKVLNYLSLARKAGAAELGEEPVGAAARAGKAYVILAAGDCGDHATIACQYFFHQYRLAGCNGPDPERI